MSSYKHHRHLGTCKRCSQRLLLNTETELCLCCELEYLREQLVDRDLVIAAFQRERQTRVARSNNNPQAATI